MAKKKKPADQPAPAQGADKHASNRMVRLPEWLHDMMKETAGEHGRPVTWEVKFALIKYLKELGKQIPEGQG